MSGWKRVVMMGSFSSVLGRLYRRLTYRKSEFCFNILQINFPISADVICTSLPMQYDHIASAVKLLLYNIHLLVDVDGKNNMTLNNIITQKKNICLLRSNYSHLITIREMSWG